jgi:hypothetical protein
MPAKDLVFLKTGAEVKEALTRRIAELEERLARRNVVLDELLADRVRLRAYLVRQQGAMPLRQSSLREDLPSEDHQEITELCRRVANIEGELGRLRLIQAHLRDEQEFEFTLEQLVSYGFSEPPTHPADPGAAPDPAHL